MCVCVCVCVCVCTHVCVIVGEVVSVGGLLKGMKEDGKGVSELRKQLATPTNHQLLPPATKQQMEKVYSVL